METLLKGKPVADKITSDVIKEVEILKKNGINPKINIVRVGQNKSDIAYENSAINRMKLCNIDYEVLKLPEDISQTDFIKHLDEINNDDSVHGILIFRPLPENINENNIKFIMNPNKDIDCLNPINIAKLIEKDEIGFAPCTPKAVMEILKYYEIDLKGKNAVVVGRSLVVGKPLSFMLLNEDATVTICHSKTENLAEITKRADILIAAVGKSHLINEDYIKDNAIVIDVGINVDKAGNITGDADTESCLKKTKYITPVPRGVGSVTTSILAQNLIKAAKLTLK